MSSTARTLEELTEKEYQYGFVTDIEADEIAKGLNARMAPRVALEGVSPVPEDG